MVVFIWILVKESPKLAYKWSFSSFWLWLSLGSWSWWSFGEFWWNIHLHWGIANGHPGDFNVDYQLGASHDGLLINYGEANPYIGIFSCFPKIGVLWVPLCSYEYVGTKTIAIGEKNPSKDCSLVASYVFLWLCWNKIVVIGNFSFFSKDCSHVPSYVLLWICWNKKNRNWKFCWKVFICQNCSNLCWVFSFFPQKLGIIKNNRWMCT